MPGFRRPSSCSLLLTVVLPLCGACCTQHPRQQLASYLCDVCRLFFSVRLFLLVSSSRTGRNELPCLMHYPMSPRFGFLPCFYPVEHPSVVLLPGAYAFSLPVCFSECRHLSRQLRELPMPMTDSAE